MGISLFHEKAPSTLKDERYRHKMNEIVQYDPSFFFFSFFGVSRERVDGLLMRRTQ